MSKKIEDALNEQINRELASAYVYLGMSSWAAENNLLGAASWLRIQWEEELVHATKLVDYINDRGGSVAYKAIGKPPAKYKNLLDVFENVLRHEEEVTQAINELYTMAQAEKDYPTKVLLDWYITEQVEEEAQPAEIISQLKLIGDSASGLLMIDGRLGERSRGPAADGA
jgi:ferritin